MAARDACPPAALRADRGAGHPDGSGRSVKRSIKLRHPCNAAQISTGWPACAGHDNFWWGITARVLSRGMTRCFVARAYPGRYALPLRRARAAASARAMTSFVVVLLHPDACAGDARLSCRCRRRCGGRGFRRRVSPRPRRPPACARVCAQQPVRRADRTAHAA
jgi:hypothetical protein